MALLGIAQGAVKVGKKLFAGIKKRRARRKERRAGKDTAADEKLEQLESLLGGGAPRTDAITASGNQLLGIMAAGNGLIPTTTAPDYEDVRATRVNQMISGGGGIDPKMIMIGAVALLAFLFFKKGR